MAIWVTSDFHFNHKNILNTCRKFESIEEHNEYIIKQYNSVVGKDDLVYVLGDAAWNPLKESKALIERLHGRKILIIGNHDQGSIGAYKSIGFIDVINHPVYYSSKIILSHYPVQECYNNPFCINVHGHLHQAVLTLPNYFNCNIELHDFKPINMKEYEKLADQICRSTRYEAFTTEWYYSFFKKINN